MTTFAIMTARIASELRRSNISADIKAAINDAIREAGKTRFYLNEVRGATFPTVAATEYYSDLNMEEIDAVYYFQGPTRYNLTVENNLDADRYAEGGVSGGQLETYSRHGMQIRLYPVPNAVRTIYVDGFGRLTPYPLVADNDTNAWMTEGEAYIRALAKSYVLRDVVRDFSEAVVYQALADDRKAELVEANGLRMGTGRLRPTQF